MKRLLVSAALLIFMAGTSYSDTGDFKQLHESADSTSLSQALTSAQGKPDSVKDLYVLGLIYLNQHQNAQARDIFSSILKAEPDYFAAKWGVAEVLRRQHDLSQSQKLLREILREHSEFPPACISLAYISYIRMDFKGAVLLAHKVLSQGIKKVDLSNYVRARLILGGSKGMMAHYGGPLSKIISGTAVLPNLKKAQELQPDSAGVLFGMGAFYLLAPKVIGGDIDTALKYLKKAIEVDPLFVDAYVRLAQAYRTRGDLDKYEFYLGEAFRIDPLNELALDTKSGSCKFICSARND